MKHLLPFVCLLLMPVLTRAEAPAKVGSLPAAMETFVKGGELSGAVTLLAQKGKILSFEATGF